MPSDVSLSNIDANVFFSYFDYNGIKNIVTPDFYYTTIPNNVCDTGDYVYYFNLQQNNFRKIFKEGKLMFQLETLIHIAQVHKEPKLEFLIGRFISREIR